MANPPPVVVQQKRGPGCFGVGCIILVVILLLLGALIGGVAYFFHTTGLKVTSAQGAPIPGYDGGNKLNQETLQKISDFNEAMQQNRPATLELTANELNTLIAHDPDFSSNQIHLFVTMKDDQAQLQASLPTGILPLPTFGGRYLNLSTAFIPSFDPESKSLDLALQSFSIGNENTPRDQLSGIQTVVDTFLNEQLKELPGMKDIYDHAKSVEIRNGKLEIETQ